MIESKFEIDFLSDKTRCYLSGSPGIQYLDFKDIQPGNNLKDIAFYRVDEISFEDKAPRKEALENVLSAMRIEGINFIYLILGDDEGVHFYYGVSRDLTKEMDTDLSIRDVGKYILEPSIKGNFRGSRVKEVEPENKRDMIELISDMRYYSMLEGVPGYTKEDEKFQGVDRLVDVMLGDSFGFMIIASAVNYDGIKEIEENLYSTYTRLAPLSKQSFQRSESANKGTSTSTTLGSSTTKGENRSTNVQESSTVTDGENEGSSWGSSKSTTKGKSTSSGGSSSSSGTSESGQEGSSLGGSRGTNHSEGKTRGTSVSSGESTSEGTSKSVSQQTSSGDGESSSITVERIDKKAQDWIKYLDDVILPRLDYGMGKGIFLTTSFLFAATKAQLKKLENTAISLYSGEKGNKVPLKAVSLARNSASHRMLKSFQLPWGRFRYEASRQEIISRSVLSQFVTEEDFHLGNWITTNELAMIAGLPQKEVVGLELKEEVEFGLNTARPVREEDQIRLGKMVQSGNVIEKEVSLDKRNLDKHIFITGVTGSGKTTTCHKILIDSGLPFLVIEPAKTEYRILSDKHKDMLIFTLGKDTTAPFRLNPFEFFRHESITSRVDMILASIEASFDMEAAIPQLIETAIYRCYEDCGWSIASNKNRIYGDSAFDDGVYAFPTLEDLVKKVDQVVMEQGFDDRLKNDYIGSIKARLQGLLVGAKGLMLNTKRSIDFEELLSKRVILEFEEIRGATEKSLVMGFVLTDLMEAIKANFLKKGAFHHITLVEEAHRLLSKYMPGDSPNKKHGVETFSDMLAEIRKYGESLIIVDQIPNKLTPEVLKNTNTKIVHRLFAEDDKNAVGNTIVLNKEQREFLSNLETGRAVVFTQGFHKAIQVQIHADTSTTGETQVDEQMLKTRVCRFYGEHYKKGIIMGSQFWGREPSAEEMGMLMELSREEKLKTMLQEFCENLSLKTESVRLLEEYMEMYGRDLVGKYIVIFHYLNSSNADDRKKAWDKEKYELGVRFITQCVDGAITAKEKNQYKEEFVIRR